MPKLPSLVNFSPMGLLASPTFWKIVVGGALVVGLYLGFEYKMHESYVAGQEDYKKTCKGELDTLKDKKQDAQAAVVAQAASAAANAASAAAAFGAKADAIIKAAKVKPSFECKEGSLKLAPATLDTINALIREANKSAGVGQ